MFAYRATENLRLNNYDDAMRRWRDAKEHRRSHVNGDRQFDGPKTWVGIRKDHNDAIRCRYHSTDVVVFHADGHVDVDCCYASRSTNNFIDEVLMHAGFRAESNQYLPTVAWIGDSWNTMQGWLVKGDVATFDCAGEGPRLVNPAPIHTYASKPDVVKQLRKDYGYADFAAWYKMHFAIHGQPNHGWKSTRNPSYRPNNLGHAAVVEGLLNREDWMIIGERCTINYVAASIQRLHPESVAVRERGPFQGRTDYMNWKKLDAQYGWAKR